jgi:small subunit ribosomal protein S9
MEKSTVYYATGKRKNAIARTWMTPGKGEIIVNERSMEEYFTVETSKIILAQPLVLTDNLVTYDIKVKVKGGGISGQAGAVRHGITKALLLADPDLRGVLKKAGFIKRDPRVKERKKYGQKGARARFQFSKR